MLSAVARLRCCICFSFLIVLSGCGGGGGGGSSEPSAPPPPPPIPAAPLNSFFPTDPSIRWNYIDNLGLSLPAAYFEAPANNGGMTVHSLVYPTGGKEHFVVTSNQVSLQGIYLPSVQVVGAGNYSADIRFAAPELMWDKNWTAGANRSFNGNGTVYVSPTYGARPVTYNGTITYNGIPNNIPTAVVTTRQITVDINMSTTIEGIPFNVSYQVVFFLARNLGIVARVQWPTVYSLDRVSGQDRDGDGMTDALDILPTDSSELRDTDGDGIGDNGDTDDDNDGVADTSDAFPLNELEWANFDNDLTGDNRDNDDDNDGVADNIDAFPYNAAETIDSDGDGTGNNADTDDDNDTYPDSVDAFPLNPAEHLDTDGDTIGNNTDPDDDNDNVTDDFDHAPLNASLWAQSVLYASDDGIALASLPGASRLTYTVKVLDSNVWSDATWTAASDQAWLSVTGSGAVNDSLTVVADPSGLTPDTMHYATISITPSGSTVASTVAHIRVGLWVGNSNPVGTNIALPWSGHTQVATDPVSPYVYVHRDASSYLSGPGGVIYVYNIYTQALVDTINTGATALGSMQISTDGRYLFAADMSNYNFDGKIIRVDLSNTANPVTIDIQGLATRLVYGRPAGHGVVILENGSVLDAATGLPFPTTFPANNNSHSMAASTNGRIFCAAKIDDYTPQGTCYRLGYGTKNGGAIVIHATSSPIPLSERAIFTAVSAGGDRYVLSPDGPSLYAPVYVRDVEGGMPVIGSLPVNAYTHQVVIGSDHAIYGITNDPNTTSEVWSYNADLTPRARQPIAERSDYFAVSGDSLMVVYATIVSQTGIQFMPNY